MKSIKHKFTISPWRIWPTPETHEQLLCIKQICDRMDAKSATFLVNLNVLTRSVALAQTSVFEDEALEDLSFGRPFSGILPAHMYTGTWKQKQ